MRRFMTILALFGFLATPQTRASEDPFDFSSPLPSKSSERRASQYFSRNVEAGEENAGLSSSRDPRDRAQTPTTRSPRNAAEIFRDGRPATNADRPPSVSFSREIARDRKPAASRTPQETLRRFDEFLKTRDVISAEHTVRSDQPEHSAIRQAQATGSESPFDDLPSLGDLDALPEKSHGACVGLRSAPRWRCGRQPTVSLRPTCGRDKAA